MDNLPHADDEDPAPPGGTPWVPQQPDDTHGVPPIGRTDGSHAPARDDGADVFVSRQDIEDAEDILFAHPPRVVTRWLCDCGAEYPCPEVRFARLVRNATVRVSR